MAQIPELEILGHLNWGDRGRNSRHLEVTGEAQRQELEGGWGTAAAVDGPLGEWTRTAGCRGRRLETQSLQRTETSISREEQRRKQPGCHVPGAGLLTPTSPPSPTPHHPSTMELAVLLETLGSCPPLPLPPLVFPSLPLPPLPSLFPSLPSLPPSLPLSLPPSPPPGKPAVMPQGLLASVCYRQSAGLSTPTGPSSLCVGPG